MSTGHGNKRRSVEETKPLLWPFLEQRLKTVDPPRDACLVALLYLSGRRISEVLHLTKRDFRVEPTRISFETFNEKVYRKKATGNFQIERAIINPLLTFEDPTTYRYYERIRPHWRTDTESGKSLSIFIIKTLASLHDDDYLFPRLRGPGHIHRNMAYKVVRFILPDGWPHLLRHERFTEVAKIYRDDPVAMHRFTFHKRFESTLQYIRELEEEKI